jgi:hypothetical protein
MFSSKQILLAVLCLSAVATTAAISGMASGQTEGIAVSPQPPLSIAVAEVNQATDVDPFASEVSDSTAGNNILVTTTGTTPAAPGNAGGQRFKTYPSDAAPVERWMYELLDLDFGNGYYAGNQGFGGGGGGFFAVPSPQQATTQAAGTTPPATGQNDMQGMGGMEGGLGGAAGQAYTPDPITLATVVMDMTSPPCSWLENDGAGGVIHIAGRSLVVRQTFQGHQEVVRLLNLLSESVADSP